MEEHSITQKTITGVIWSALERFSTLAFQMICTLIIAQFLSPEDFGIVGMLTIFTAIAQTLVDSGFRTALIRKSDANNIDYSTVFFFNIILSGILYVALYYASPLIASFYNMPCLEKVARYIFLVIPITAFGLIQGTILTKKLNFKLIARVSILSALLSGIVGIIVAYECRNFWAIVIQNILMYSFQTLFLWIFAKWTPILVFSISSIKGMFSFSFNMMLSGLIGTIFNNLYSLLIGKLYTATDLGNYTQAQKLQSIPSTSITEVIQRVTYPVLSQFQDNDDQLKNAYRRIIGITFLIVSSVMFWLMGISYQLFDVLFDDRWVVAGKFFAILCFNGVFYPLHSININILTVKGKSNIYLYLEIARRSICVAVVLVTSFFSIEVFVWGLVAYSVIVLIINLIVCGNYINYNLKSQLKDLGPTFIIGLLTMIIIKYIPIFLQFPSIVVVLIQTIIAVVLFYLLFRITSNQYFKEFQNIAFQYIYKIKSSRV